MIFGNRIYAFNEEAKAELTKTNESISINLEVSSNDTELLEFACDYLLNKQNDNVVYEGANSEYTDAIKEVVNGYRDNIKEARKLFKDGQYSKAKVLYQKAEKEAKDIEKKIEAVKSDTAISAIIGYFCALGVSFAQAVVAVITVYIPIVGTFVAVNNTIQAAEEWKRLIKDFKTTGVNEKTLNIYRIKLLAFVKILDDVAQLGQDACDAKMKKK